MKTSLMKQALAAAIAVLALFSAPAIRAHEGHDHSEHEAPKVGSAREAWNSAQASLKAIVAAAATKQQQPIHNEQEKLAASLKQLQQLATGGDKARLDGAIKNAIAASEKVHAAADANDFGKVDSSLKTLESTMSLVEKQLPPDAK